MSRDVAGACLLLVLAAAPPARAQSRILIPPSHEKQELLSSHTYPWAAASSNTARYGCRVQLCYDSVYFTAQGWKGRQPILRLRWRADGGQVTQGGTYATVTVEMSTCAFDHRAMSRTFAQNHGRDRTGVFRGRLRVGRTRGTKPNDFHVDLLLSKAFAYDPAAGDLLVDVMVAPSWTGGTVARADSGTSGFGRTRHASMLMNRYSDRAVRGDLLRGVVQLVEVEFRSGGRAWVSPYGASCKGSAAAAPGLISVTRPILGARFDVAITGISPMTRMGFFLLSGSRIATGLDLGTIGAPGCKAWIGLPPALSDSFTPTRSVAVHGYPLPANPSLAGARLYLQGAVLVPAANALGLLTTNGLEAVAGTQ